VFRKSRPHILSWAIWIQFTHSHPISLRYILILYSLLCLGLYSDFFSSGIPIEMYVFLLSPMHAICLTSLIFFESGVIILVIAYLMTSNCKAPHYVVIFSTHVTSSPIRIFFSASYWGKLVLHFFYSEDEVSTFLRNISVHLLKNVLLTLGLRAQRQVWSLMASVAHARNRKLRLTRDAFTA
jgi:hypothetical protein